MNDDFTRLANHDKHRGILAAYLQYRIPKATRAQVQDIIERCGKKKLTAAVALDELSDIHWNSVSFIVKPGAPSLSSRAETTSFSENRIKARIRDIEKFKSRIDAANVKCYADIGCGNGSITAGIGAYLGLPAEQIFGADIDTWAGHEHKSESVAGFTFKTIAVNADKPNYSIDLPNGTCQLITLLMVLHHIKDDLLPLVFAEITRILAPGGLVLIREHDSPNEMVDSLINIEHAIFETVMEQLSSGEEFSKTYYGHYRTSREWRAMFIQFGFVHLESTPPYGATRGYYSIFLHSGAKAPIDIKTTPELIKDAKAAGASADLIKEARTDADLKKIIVSGGSRGLAGLS